MHSFQTYFWGVKCPMELSTYFRINSAGTGQFERTLLVADEGASVSYLEGCTAPMRDENQLHAAVVELLLESGASVGATTGGGSTALAIACQKGQLECAWLLLGASAAVLGPPRLALRRSIRTAALPLRHRAWRSSGWGPPPARLHLRTRALSPGRARAMARPRSKWASRTSPTMPTERP